MARQPIFDTSSRVGAYELLYRSGGLAENTLDPVDERATANLLVNSFLAIGLENLTGGRRAYINFDRGMLLAECATTLPHEAVVVEVPHDVPADAQVVAACRKLKEAGYSLALNDLAVYDAAREPLYEIADVVKVDFERGHARAKWTVPERLRHRGLRFLAEKVESREEHKRALDCGYDLFQGYFYARPQVVKGKAVPGFRLNFLRLLKELNHPDGNFDAAERVIKSDAALSYQFLKLVNSAAFVWRQRITEIRQALVAMGLNETRKWASLLCLSDMASDRPREIVVQSIVRGQFCESLAAPLGLAERRSDLFFLGLFSLLDAIVEMPLAKLLEELPLADDVREAVLGQEGPLSDPLHLVTAFERGDWMALQQLTARMRLPSEDVLPLYLSAVRRADEIYGTG
ncbi:MAG: HDOD domain-containing protein [Armatimonadetes bacterium]|nr:HDOD domain-containing protein [Armatimonadota bacterium]